ncbi:ABC-type sugar transport system, periplasmic component [Longilinea arvoryzae]|uniref:ABC-type sugar transport system, periplasmic component n=2 Tax=Longilinea arvoryzae TaxID=360412 RepID=A0A0S7BLD9_9CHLR|nr:ABC-type sugar transport system, periplasmic component [Longilinea arvoryzae]
MRVWQIVSLFLLISLSACQVIGLDAPSAATATPVSTRTPKPLPTATATLPPDLRVSNSDLKGLQIRFLHPWIGDTAETIDLLVDTFNRSNEWGFKVKAQSAGGTGALYQQMESMDVGDLPNLVAAPNEYLLSWHQSNPEMLADLTSYVQHSEWGLTGEQISDFLPAFWQQDVSGDVRLGVPLLRDANLLFYNLTWAAELGYHQPPTTPDEFRAQACAAAVANRSDRTISNDGTGGWIVETGSGTLWSWLRSFGATPYIPETASYQFSTTQSEAAFSFLRTLVDDDCAWKSRLATPYDYFANRQALFYSGMLEDTLIQAHTMDRLKIEDQWTVIPYPSTDGSPVVVAGGPSLAVIHTTPEEQLAAWLFARWLLAPEHLAELTESASGLPVTQSAINDLQVFGGQRPQWRAGLTYREQVQTPPANAGWRSVRSLLEDAGYQALLPSVKLEQIPDVLRMLDGMIPEVEGTPPAS